MANKFIILVDESFTARERDLITKHFKGKLGYWHWIGNVWLLATKQDSYTASSIRDEVKSIVPKGMILVLDLNEDTWAGFGQKKKFEWMHKNWSKTQESLPIEDQSDNTLDSTRI